MNAGPLMPFSPPSRLYVIVDPLDTGRDPVELAALVLRAGARWLQLRSKNASSAELTELARRIAPMCRASGAVFIVNDRPDVARLAGADGVHVGQEDLPPGAARRVLGRPGVIGLSTHDEGQVRAAVEDDSVDYVAFGPIHSTTSKANPDPVQGLEGLRRARALCPHPLVAIGGIDAANAPDVIAAGADAVAVIGAVSRAPDPARAVTDLLAALGEGPAPDKP